MKITLHSASSPTIQELLRAFIEEARPFLTHGRKGRIVVNYGGDRTFMEAARFRDIEPEKEISR